MKTCQTVCPCCRGRGLETHSGRLLLCAICDGAGTVRVFEDGAIVKHVDELIAASQPRL
jgi:hypothetical protein